MQLGLEASTRGGLLFLLPAVTWSETVSLDQGMCTIDETFRDNVNPLYNNA